VNIKRRDLLADEVQYLVLPDAQNPWLLARVRWPDVFQAISPARPYWQSDPGLFDLPYDPSGVPITAERAEAIAAEWGAVLPGEGESSLGPSLIRRMPANWSNLTPAEKRAWSISPEPRGRIHKRRRRVVRADTSAEPAVLIERLRQQMNDFADAGLVYVRGDQWSEQVLDLTDAALADGRAHNGCDVIDLTDAALHRSRHTVADQGIGVTDAVSQGVARTEQS
jgi:hypothetical protein